MARYKSDIEIAQEFQDMQVINVDVKPSGKSGWIELHFPHAGDHVGGGAEDITDSWIKYDNDRIAFGNWYPDDTYNALVRVVRQHNNGECHT